MTFWYVDGFAMDAIRASIEVSEDGQSLMATYTVEYLEPDGTSTGQIGPGTIEATKLQIEAPGTPIASFEDAFGTPPEATPAG